MSRFAPLFMWKLAKKAVKTAVLLPFISNETLKLGLAKWQVPEEIILKYTCFPVPETIWIYIFFSGICLPEKQLGRLALGIWTVDRNLY